MRFVIAGSSGFLGTALRDHLAGGGHTVIRLVRGSAATPSESTWDPHAGAVDTDVVAAADVVVNLAGAPIAHWPWTTAYRREILRSRVAATSTLARAVASASRPPVFLVASGIAGYGDDRGAEVLTESSTDGSGFLAGVVRAWEDAAEPARHAGARVCHLRNGLVLGPGGGAFTVMSLPFRLGLGGRIGSGRQYFSAVSLADWVRAVSFLAATDDAEGRYNVSCPHPGTNADFTRLLAAALHRPAIMWVPAVALRTALGGLADQVLGSLRVYPQRLTEAGFEFQHPDLAAIVRAALRR
ncbi:MAG: TIGR01777 family oxidoreductase [Nocardioidaceae bacterium]